MEERRRFVRLDTRLDATYTVLTSGKPRQVRTKNIAAGGICLFSDQPLAVGTQLQVAMRLPGREQPVNFVAEVIWSEEYEMVGREQRYRSVELGVRFVEIAPSDRDAVMQHVILGLKAPGAPG